MSADELVVQASPADVGEVAAAHGVVLHRLAEGAGGLEDVFLQITGGIVPPLEQPQHEREVQA